MTVASTFILYSEILVSVVFEVFRLLSRVTRVLYSLDHYPTNYPVQDPVFLLWQTSAMYSLTQSSMQSSPSLDNHQRLLKNFGRSVTWSEVIVIQLTADTW